MISIGIVPRYTSFIMGVKKKYDFKTLEKEYTRLWKEHRVYEPNLDKAEKPFYNLMMFPYPSAEGLHVGNMYAFTGSDIYGRFMRMQGNNVFEPIGLDGFGIHSENYALKIGAHPMAQAKISEERFYKQLEMVGNGFAWEEKAETYAPDFYKWTQWLFLTLWRAGLAYRKRQAVNWCPSCKTVLADEQVENGKCERCRTPVESRELEQWFFRITKYADRLLKNLETLDWSEKVKTAQKGWIGRSEGARINFKISDIQGISDIHGIEVFTTRPDTLFGATFLVISPELANEWMKGGWDMSQDIKKYVEGALLRRGKEGYEEKEKTGIFSGIEAFHPATGEKLPVWISDYVLAGYGTGAIMAVPVHDARDYDFAKKFNLPIKEVVVPERIDKRNPPILGKEKVERRNVQVIVRNQKNGTVLCLERKNPAWVTFPMGGIEEGEDILIAAKRELLEETGYVNVINGKVLGGQVRAEYFATHKDQNRISFTSLVVFDLENEEREEISEEEKGIHEIVWKDLKSMTPTSMVHAEMDIWLERLRNEPTTYEEEGVLINSGEFSGLASSEAMKKIGEKYGKWETQFRLRDWLISRQRYWGVPIPMIFCETCAKAGKGENKEMPGWYAEKEENLPVTLPFVENFKPIGTGESPLASVKEFYETECPVCKGKAKRETDVADTFLDSSWYYLSYLLASAGFKETPNSKKMQALFKHWLPIPMYIGGAEHSVLHLLYVRFVAMALHDAGVVKFEEPIMRFRAHGLLIKDGAKMSKSKGNVINPDDYIKRFGADAFRTYLMFLAPFEDGGDFRDEGLLGPVRFLERVWKLKDKVKSQKLKAEEKDLEKSLHKTIKKVTEDIESLHYNTAISALMILLNEFEKEKEIPEEYFRDFLKLLAPFAPFITEGIWSDLMLNSNSDAENFKSIHHEAWPTYNPKKIIDESFTLVVQVNGKLRAEIEVPTGITEDEAKTRALADSHIVKLIEGKTLIRIVYVPNRLVNIVV